MLGAIAIFVSLAAWALASPVGSSPDEDFHLISSWCGQGLRSGVCEPGTDAATRSVPKVLEESPCFAFKPQVSAACQSTGYASSDKSFAVTARGNFTGTYPPVFYFVESLFVGNDITRSVIAMRIANAALFVILIGTVYATSTPGLRRPLILGASVTMVPLGMFLVPSINPSGWAVLSAITLAVSVLGYLTAQDRPRRIVLAILSAVSLLIGAGARGDAAAYSLIAIGASLILCMRWQGAFVRRAIYPVVLAIVAALVFLTTGQSGAVDHPAAVHLYPQNFVKDLFDVPDLWVGALGKWGLGWLDTYMPPYVWVMAAGLFGAVLFATLSGTGRRHALAVGLVGLATWIVPTYVQYLAAAPVGTGVQPRYILPLMVILAVIALARLDGPAFRLSAGQRWVIVIALATANAEALYMNLRRYVTGTGGSSINLDVGGQWWWSIPVPPLGVWAIGAASFCLGLILLTRELTVAAPATDLPGTVDAATVTGSLTNPSQQPSSAAPE